MYTVLNTELDHFEIKHYLKYYEQRKHSETVENDKGSWRLFTRTTSQSSKSS